MARKPEIVTVERDREPLMTLAVALQTEVARLTSLYESHCLTLAAQAPLGDRFGLKTVAERLVGVRQVSALPASGGDGVHTKIGAGPAAVPVPTLSPGRNHVFGEPVVLPSEVATASLAASGWFQPVGEWRYFWYRRDPATMVVLTIDSDAVRGALRGALQSWSADAVRPVQALGGPDAVMETGGGPLVTIGEKPERFPDLILPVRSAFGDWEVVSWHRERAIIRWRWPVFASAAAFSAALGWLGIAGFVWQRRLQRLASQRVSFVNRVSHELRTPLTNIVLNADLAADALETQPREANRRLDVVREEAARLTRLVDNVLAFSRRDSIRPAKPDPMVNPRDLVASVMHSFEPAFMRREMTLRLTGEAPPCLLDPDALTQILANLLSNAEKYAPGGDVTVFLERAGTDLVIQVRDQGPGVPEADAGRIFEPFVRLHDRLTEGVAGAGLGLSIARDAAARLGGTLDVLPPDPSAAPTNGAVFELRLPLYASEPVPRVTTESDASDGSLPPASSPLPTPP